MASKQMTVTLYQNGIGQYHRVYDLDREKPTPITLNVKGDAIGDVIGSLKVLGKVKYIQAPSFPTKREPNFQIEPNNVTKCLFKTFTGASVKISLNGSTNEIVEGMAMGAESEFNFLQGEKVENTFLTVCTKDGIRRLSLTKEVKQYQFTCPDIQGEIERALAYNVQKIKPDSVPLSLTVQAAEENQCKLRYVAPTPAWKWSYRFVQDTGGWRLFTYAVVDNDSDDEWTNATIKVATGQPITFSTDIAEVRIPKRGKVNLITGSATGAVEADSGLEKGVASRGARGGAPRLATAQALMADSLESTGGPAAAPPQPEAFVTMGEASVAEVGDANIFTCPDPMTIAPHKSALAFLFALDMKDTDDILYYVPNKNKTRCYRALKATNPAKHGLGRGLCEIEAMAVHNGMAVMSSDTKPGETAFIVYAMDSGTKFQVEEGQVVLDCTKHNLGKNVMVSEFTQTQTITYRMANLKGTEQTLTIDHRRHTPKSVVTCVGAEVCEDVENGAVKRLRLKLDAKREAQTVVVTETLAKAQRLEAAGIIDWVRRHPTSPLMKQGSMPAISALIADIDQVTHDIEENNSQVAALTNEQARLRANLATITTGTDAETMKRSLMTAENSLTKIEKTTLPDLRKRLKDLNTRLQKELPEATAIWTPSPLDKAAR